MFIGRKNELALLENDWTAPKPAFWVLYGRRRIGKSTLLNHFAKGKGAFIFLAGKEKKRLQLKRFVDELGSVIQDPLTSKVMVQEWDEALKLLDRNIDSICKIGNNKKAILIFDEFQWMCHGAPELISSLQRFWDNSWKDKSNVFLILCGSSVSFMLGDVLSRKSPLFGRRTRSLKLQPFKLNEAAVFLPGKNKYEVCETYMVSGGVPKYLEAFQEAASFRRLLVQNAFDQTGYLFDDIHFVLSEQLKEKEHYFRILSELSKRSQGISELSECTGVPTGQITFYMERLQLLGFVTRHIPLDAAVTSKKVKYRLDDYYLRFYFSFIHDVSNNIINQTHTLSFNEHTRGKWDSFAGLAFEHIARDHAHKIVAKADQSGQIKQIGSYWQRPTKMKKGCQIDLIIECLDKTLLICECKWSRKKIGMKALESLMAKIASYPNPNQYAIQPVLIAAAGVTKPVKETKGLLTIQLEELF